MDRKKKYFFHENAAVTKYMKNKMRKLKQNENVDNDKVSWKKLFHIYYLKIFVKILFLYLVFIRCVGNILIIYYIIFLHYKNKIKK